MLNSLYLRYCEWTSTNYIIDKWEVCDPISQAQAARLAGGTVTGRVVGQEWCHSSPHTHVKRPRATRAVYILYAVTSPPVPVIYLLKHLN